MDKLTKHVANTLRAARLAKGMTQEELAGQLDMATESISHFERSVTIPSLKTIAAAARALDVDLSDLFQGVADKRPISARRAEQEAILRRHVRELDDRKLAVVIEVITAIDKLS